MAAMAEFDGQPKKLVFLGDPAVGKTALVRRFNTDLSPDKHLVPDFDFAARLAVDKKSYHVKFLDMSLAVNDEYARVRPLAYQDTDMFMLCFDITTRASFTNIKEKWIKEIRHHMPFTPFLLIGNKKDLRKSTDQLDPVLRRETCLSPPDTVLIQEAWELAKSHDTLYVENSSLTGEQVNEVVNTALRKVVNHRTKSCRCNRLFKWIKCKRHK